MVNGSLDRSRRRRYAQLDRLVRNGSVPLPSGTCRSVRTSVTGRAGWPAGTGVAGTLTCCRM